MSQPNPELAWYEGYEARCNGVPVNKGPFRSPSVNFKAWQRGWECANEHLRGRKIERDPKG